MLQISKQNATIKKVGQKFGLTANINASLTHQVVSNLGNDILGDIYMNFGEKVILSQPISGIYLTKEQSTGYCTLSIEPRQGL